MYKVGIAAAAKAGKLRHLGFGIKKTTNPVAKGFKRYIEAMRNSFSEKAYTGYERRGYL